MSNQIERAQQVLATKLQAASPDVLEFLKELRHLNRKELVELGPTMTDILDALIANTKVVSNV
jgi:hypothetical protein